MRKLLLTLAALTIAFSSSTLSSPAVAGPVRPDILQLMEETKLKELSESSLKQMQAAFEKQFVGSLAGNPQAAEAAKKMMDRLNPVLQKKLSWEVMKDDYARMYEETFTQEEVKGLIEFYRTPIGQSFLKKMPALMQKVSELSARRLQEVMPEVQKVAMEVGAEMQQTAKSPGAAPAPAK